MSRFLHRAVIWGLVWIVGLNVSTTSQANTFIRLTTQDGLSQSTVNAIQQDHRGLMWFATLDGLNRYDGRYFTHYRHRVHDPYSLASNEVFCLFEDQQQRLWVGTQQGLSLYDRRLDRFYNYLPDEKRSNSTSINAVWAIAQTRDGMLWIAAGGGGLSRFDPDTTTFYTYRHEADNPLSLSDDAVWPLYVAEDDTLWVGTDGGGLNHFNPHTEQFQRYFDQPEQLANPNINAISAIQAGDNHSLWLSTLAGLVRFFPADGHYTLWQHQSDQPDSPPSGVLWSLLRDHNGDLWVGSDGGGLSYLRHPQNPHWQHYRHDIMQSNSLSSNAVLALYQDEAGILWIGTDGGGVNQFHSHNERFQHFFHNPQDADNSLSDNMVLALQGDKQCDSWWVGTREGGLNHFRHETKQVEHYTFAINDPHSLPSKEVTALALDQQQRLWVGTGNGVLSRYRESSNDFQHYPLPQKLTNNRIRVLFPQGKTLWVGTRYGLYQFDIQTNQFIQHYTEEQGLASNIIFSLYSDAQDNLWIGTQGGGLARLNLAEQRIDSYPMSWFSHRDISSIAMAPDQTLWLGTAAGLNHFDPDNMQVTVYREPDGLSNEVIHSLLFDDNGDLWISSNQGLSRFSPTTGIFQHFDVHDGLQSSEFNTAATKGACGSLLFGGINGFNQFYPQNIQQNNYVPPVVLTEFTLFNQLVHPGEEPLTYAIGEMEHLTLSYQEDFFAFRFAALNYIQPFKNQYRYQLVGFDQDWINSDNRDTAYYTNVPPGHYTFMVHAANNDGVWNTQGVQLSLTITPPFWETWQFQLSGVVILILLIYFGFRWRIHTIECQNKLLEQHVTQRTQELTEANQKLAEAKRDAERANRYKSEFLANMSHELRTPLNGILGYTQIFLHGNQFDPKTRNGVQIIHRSAEHLLLLINDILDLAKIEAGKLEIHPHDMLFRDFLHDVVDLFKLRAEQKELRFVYHAEPDDDAPDFPAVVYADEKRLRQVLLNLLSNAVKFTQQGKVCLTVRCQAERTRFEVSDTGNGIPATQLQAIFSPFHQLHHNHQRDAEGTGLGLSITQNLVKKMGGQLRVDSELGRGSVFWFEIDLPIIKTHSQHTTARDTRQIVGYQRPDNTEPLRILILDNLYESRVVLGQFLTQLGFVVKEIFAFSDVEAALHEFKANVLLLDLGKPIDRGIRCLTQLRNQIEWQDLVIITVSSHLFANPEAVSRAAGSNGFLSKPLYTKHLLRLLEEQCNLIWCYAGESTADAAKINQKMVAPSTAELCRLLKLAKSGHISAIVKQVDGLQSQPELQPFVQEVTALANGFKIRKLKSFIENLLDNAS